MNGCGRQWCTVCQEELIHRDHRKGYESASALGQIIWREGPYALSATDLDIASRKGLRDGSQLLRLIEQKQPGHRFDRPQEQTLRLLDAIIVHAALCEAAADLRVDSRSGVYVVRGDIGAATEYARDKTMLLEDQEIEKFWTGQTFTITEHEQLFRFLDPENKHRRHNGPRHDPRHCPECIRRQTRRAAYMSTGDQSKAG